MNDDQFTQWPRKQIDFLNLTLLYNLALKFYSHFDCKAHSFRECWEVADTSNSSKSFTWKRHFWQPIALRPHQELGMILVEDSGFKIEVTKKSFNKKCALKIILHQKKQNYSDNFWHRKFTLEVQFWPFCDIKDFTSH